MDKEFAGIARKSEELYREVKKKAPAAAPYILTNAHRRRVLFTVNARELYHIARLREDKHAQWDIQQLSRGMSSQAKEAAPLTMFLICGKDAYAETFQNVFEKASKAAGAKSPL